jgi:hypothetical protein
MSTLLRQLKGESQRYTKVGSYGLGKLLDSAVVRIAELEKEASNRKGFWVTSKDLHVWQLEQQAKGCTDGAKACSISFGEAVVIGETELDGYAKDLLRQAQALKEKGNE